MQLKRYQVTLAAIEEWTGLDFGALRDADELAWMPFTLRAAVRRILPQRLLGAPPGMDDSMH